MKRIIYFLMVPLLLFSGCDKNSDDSMSSASRNTVVQDGSIPFEELLLLVSVKATDTSYLVVESIDSVCLYVNDLYWSTSGSRTLDIAKIAKIEVDNTYQTADKVHYLIIADQEIEEPDFSTAGDFARYLNALYELKPGEYACFIESFQITFNDKTTKKYYPFEYVTFKVEQNTKSAFVGEIELKAY